MSENDSCRMFEFVSSCNDPEKLRTIIENARARGVTELADAALHRLVSILPSEKPGSLEHDFWRSLHAFEEVRSEERGRRILLSRTRQKVARVGVPQTLIDWALDTKQTEGFRMLLERDMPELTGEAIVLRRPDEFDPHVVAAAREKLEKEGVDIASVTTYE